MNEREHSVSSGPSTDRHNEPVIDPTTNVLDLVRAAIERQDDLRRASQAADRDYINGQIEVLVERLRGIDQASEILAASVNNIPEAAIQKLRELMDERFQSIKTQFQERDTRQERESRDNKVAVDAAFAAQKEAAAKQEETFAKSIDKSEGATAETIAKLTELTRTQDEARRQQIGDGLSSLAGKIDDLKDGTIADLKTALAELRQVVATGEGRGTGADAHASSLQAQSAARSQVIAAGAAIFLVLVTLAGILIVVLSKKNGA